MAADDWISDPATLEAITAKEDVHGEWWEIPDDELFDCRMALFYLDAGGINFYLPAYLTLALRNDFIFRSYNGLIPILTSEPKSGEMGREYFHTRFSKIVGAKKVVCIEFLRLLKLHLESLDQTTFTKSHLERVERLMDEEFWAGK